MGDVSRAESPPDLDMTMSSPGSELHRGMSSQSTIPASEEEIQNVLAHIRALRVVSCFLSLINLLCMLSIVVCDHMHGTSLWRYERKYTQYVHVHAC